MLAIRLLPVLLVVVLMIPLISGADVPTFVHEGRAYVELSRVAESVNSRLEVTPESTQAFLRTPGHVVTFTRNWARVSVDGTPIVLSAPVRVDKDGRWIAPEKFMTDVLPRIAPVVVTAPPAPAVSAPRPTTPPPVAAVPPAALPPPAPRVTTPSPAGSPPVALPPPVAPRVTPPPVAVPPAASPPAPRVVA